MREVYYDFDIRVHCGLLYTISPLCSRYVGSPIIAAVLAGIMMVVL